MHTRGQHPHTNTHTHTHNDKTTHTPTRNQLLQQFRADARQVNGALDDGAGVVLAGMMNPLVWFIIYKDLEKV